MLGDSVTAFESGESSEVIKKHMSKSAPLSESRLCPYCGVQSGVTSHGNLSECVDALHREVTWLKDHLVKVSRVYRSPSRSADSIEVCVSTSRCLRSNSEQFRSAEAQHPAYLRLSGIDDLHGRLRS
jgi:hypothetical protein